jgi:hypothetical protein
MRRRWLGLGAVMVTALGSAGCAPKWIGDAMFMSSQAGGSVLVKASAGGSRISYLRRHSLENGALLASVQFRHGGSRSFQAQCEPALPGRLWCLENSSDPLDNCNGLRVRDAESLQIIAGQDQILGGTPELAGTPLLKVMRVDPKTHGFVFESRDGYAWIIDPTTLAPARFAGDVASIPRPDHGPPPTDTGYEFIGGTRKTLVRDGVRLHPERTYLNGRVVMRLDNPPRVLALEDVVDHAPTLWCLFADGTAAWKVTNVPEVLVTAKLYRDTVVLVTSPMLIAVRTQDGAVVWTSPP